MIAVQRRFGMKGKVVAYHGIQSFKAGEVTPEEAFEIGKETARRMWGNKYQVLVTVHLNTDNLHCHFVVNPCSFKNGAKFKNKIGDHWSCERYLMRFAESTVYPCPKQQLLQQRAKEGILGTQNGQMTHRDMLKRILTIACSIHQTARNLNGSYGDSATLSTGGGYLLSIKVGTEPCGLKASGLRKQPLRRASLKTKANITSMTNGTLIYRTRQSKHPLSD